MNSEPTRTGTAPGVLLSGVAVNAVTKGKSVPGGLLASGAGFASGPLQPGLLPQDRAAFVYCVKGGGWCELNGRLHAIRKHELFALPAGVPRSCGTHASNPWTIHWVVADGPGLQFFVRELRLNTSRPVIHVGDDPQISRLFAEVLQALRRGQDYVQVLVASSALTHLLAVLVAKSRGPSRESTGTVQRIAAAIIHMSEHLEETLRVTELARSANLSPAYFTELFKQQTGCAPREYLRLLRMHRACQLLRDTDAPMKEIASRVGYQDPLHFSRQFKAFEGVSPTHYRDAAGS